MGVNINIKRLPCGKGIMQGFDPVKKVQSIDLIGFSKPGASHPVPPATIGALRAPVFCRIWR